MQQKKRDWRKIYRGCNDLCLKDLADVFKCLSLSRQIYSERPAVVRLVLLHVWPLTDFQRRHLLQALKAEELSRDELLDFDKSLASFSQIKRQQKELEFSEETESRNFGVSFMGDRNEKRPRRSLENDFDPSRLAEEESGDSQLELPQRVLIDLKPDSRRRIKARKPSQGSEKMIPMKRLSTVAGSPIALGKGSAQQRPKLYKNKLKMHKIHPFSSKDALALKQKKRHRQRSVNRTLPTKAGKSKLKQKSNESDISLDVKRTYVHRKDFRHADLEKVLWNMAHPRMGNFSYYQGLNYLVAYVLDLMGDPVETYNLSICLLEKHFREYIGQNLEGIGVLTHTLKRLIQIFLKDLAQLVERNENVISGATSSNWILTLFTMLKKYKRRVRLLDQVFDIFAAQGWVGFFKCVLVILYYLERDLLKCDSEQVLLFMNGFAKRGFEKLGEIFPNKRKSKEEKSASISIYSDRNIPVLDVLQSHYTDNEGCGLEATQFNFKEEIKQFSLVSTLLLTDLSVEYKNTKIAFDSSWKVVLEQVQHLHAK